MGNSSGILDPVDPKERYPRPDTNTPTIRLGNVEDDEFDLPPHLRLEPGDEVGHYKILSLVAEGGFGIVYLAEQYNPVRRRVALKIIKPGMDTRAVIARFEAERHEVGAGRSGNRRRTSEDSLLGCIEVE